METSIRILILEDNENDAELIERELRKAGFAFTATRATNKESFIKALNVTPDVILTDYALPGFDGISALSMARKNYPDIPVILISGAIGEETAIDVITSGATDYVLKHRLSRLGPALRRALKESHNATARRQAQEELLHAKEDWERTFDAVPDLMAILDCQHNIVRVNKAMASRLGVTPAEAVGLKCHDVVHGTPSPPAFCPHAITCRDGMEHVSEISEPRLGGVFLVSTTPIRDSAGLLIGSIHVARDITERKRADEEREKLIGQLASANRELNEFAHAVSHDLKAPLRAVAVLAEMINSDSVDKLDDEAREKLDLLKSRVMQMHRLIEGVLEYSRLGQVEGTSTNTDIKKVVERAIDLVVPQNGMVVAIETDLPTITCDPVRMYQVFQNLIGNAVKHMDKPTGEVSIGCTPVDGNWRFFVRDNGPGIEKRHHERIFKIFQTLKPKDETGGTGIGLSIVRRIVEELGGKVWVESEIGKGSTFFFTIPQKKS